jgi:hypothetical protein
MAYVYRHIRLDNNQPFYIGISKRDSPNYERAYCKTKANRSIYWHNIYNKTKIEVEILFENISYELAKQKEIEFISLYKRISEGGTLVNLTSGGNGTFGYKNEKLSERNKSGLWKGKKHSEETKRLMSLKHKGIKKTENQIKSIKIASKKRLSSTKNPNFKGIIYIYNKTGILHTCISVPYAVDFTGLSMHHIYNCLKNKTNGYKGFYFTRDLEEANKFINIK